MERLYDLTSYFILFHLVVIFRANTNIPCQTECKYILDHHQYTFRSYDLCCILSSFKAHSGIILYNCYLHIVASRFLYLGKIQKLGTHSQHFIDTPVGRLLNPIAYQSRLAILVTTFLVIGSIGHVYR